MLPNIVVRIITPTTTKDASTQTTDPQVAQIQTQTQLNNIVEATTTDAPLITSRPTSPLPIGAFTESTHLNSTQLTKDFSTKMMLINQNNRNNQKQDLHLTQAIHILLQLKYSNALIWDEFQHLEQILLASPSIQEYQKLKNWYQDPNHRPEKSNPQLKELTWTLSFFESLDEEVESAQPKEAPIQKQIQEEIKPTKEKNLNQKKKKKEKKQKELSGKPLQNSPCVSRDQKASSLKPIPLINKSDFTTLVSNPDHEKTLAKLEPIFSSLVADPKVLKSLNERLQAEKLVIHFFYKSSPYILIQDKTDTDYKIIMGRQFVILQSAPDLIYIMGENCDGTMSDTNFNLFYDQLTEDHPIHDLMQSTAKQVTHGQACNIKSLCIEGTFNRAQKPTYETLVDPDKLFQCLTQGEITLTSTSAKKQKSMYVTSVFSLTNDQVVHEVSISGDQNANWIIAVNNKEDLNAQCRITNLMADAYAIYRGFNSNKHQDPRLDNFVIRHRMLSNAGKKIHPLNLPIQGESAFFSLINKDKTYIEHVVAGAQRQHLFSMGFGEITHTRLDQNISGATTFALGLVFINECLSETVEDSTPCEMAKKLLCKLTGNVPIFKSYQYQHQGKTIHLLPNGAYINEAREKQMYFLGYKLNQDFNLHKPNERNISLTYKQTPVAMLTPDQLSIIDISSDNNIKDQSYFNEMGVLVEGFEIKHKVGQLKQNKIISLQTKNLDLSGKTPLETYRVRNGKSQITLEVEDFVTVEAYMINEHISEIISIKLKAQQQPQSVRVGLQTLMKHIKSHELKDGESDRLLAKLFEPSLIKKAFR